MRFATRSINAIDLKQTLKAASSPYYPPRAGFSRPFLRLVDCVRRSLHESRLGINLPYPGSIFTTLKRCVIPADGFRAIGWTTLARAAFGIWLIALAVYVIWLGEMAASLGWSVMIAIHTSGVVCLLFNRFPVSVGRRVLVTLGVALLLGQVVYGTVQRVLGQVFIPLQSRGQTVIVRRSFDPEELQRGDLVGYRISREIVSPMIIIKAGIAVDRVIAVPGDEVNFTPSGFVLNGQLHAPLQAMPKSGSIVLSQDTWLIWPSLSIRSHGQVPEEEIAAANLQAATVPRDAIIGKPYKTWLWRPQDQ